MNIDIVKSKLENNLNKKVVVTVYGLRNKINKYEGILYKIYPNIFSILEDGVEKSFSYNDYITGDIKIKFLWLHNYFIYKIVEKIYWMI